MNPAAMHHSALAATAHLDPSIALAAVEKLIARMGEDDNYGERWQEIAQKVIEDCRDYLETT